MKVQEVVRASFGLLDRSDRRRLRIAMLAQMATVILDLVGVVLVGSIGALTVTILGGETPPPVVTTTVSKLGLGSLSQMQLVTLLAGGAAAALLAKSVLSPLLMAWILRFLAGREAVVSARLTRELLSRPLTFVQRRSTQDTAAAVVQAANAATTVVLGQAVAAVSEIALLAVLAVTLLGFNFPLAAAAVAFFALIGFGLQRVLGHRAAQYAAERLDRDIASLRSVQEALGAYREITVSHRRSYFVDHIKELRSEAALASANLQFVALLPKYVSEAALVLGAFAMGAWLFKTEPIGIAAGTLALFLAAATRVMPSLLRLQSATLSIRGAAGSASRTFALADDLVRTGGSVESDRVARTTPSDTPAQFSPTIELRDVYFSHHGSGTPAIRGVNLSVGVGNSVALIGRTGAGKSTLADLILGVLHPDRGSVRVGGLPPAEAIETWPGGMAYVPQDVMLTNTSVRSNVALGLPQELVDDALVWDALQRAQLDDFVRREPDGLDSQIGERGLRLSGGQRQRLGIARALYTRPRLLVLDEATSALDAETEQGITEMLRRLSGDVTTVVVAHRLSTVRHVDIVVYLDDGEALAVGSFDEVRAQVPALHRQAELMGLQQG